MLDRIGALPGGAELLSLACETAGEDIAARTRAEGEAYLRRNEVASLVTAAYSLAAKQLLDEHGVVADAVAGYSVGQLVAMTVAGMMDAPQLMDVIWNRACLMNESPGGRGLGKMLAVIGLRSEQVQSACDQASAADGSVMISNQNCPGQLTVAGDAAAVERVRVLLQALRPRRLVDVNASGAWHCHMMEPAAARLGDYLRTQRFATARLPVIDNVTGNLLPDGEDELREALARQLCHPVLWEAGMRWLVAFGVQDFVEAGYGTMLTKIGFFIDRSCRHLPFEKYLELRNG